MKLNKSWNLLAKVNHRPYQQKQSTPITWLPAIIAVTWYFKIERMLRRNSDEV